MCYSGFATEDFVKDPYFQAWVLQDNPEINAFWELWMELYPEKAAAVSAAMDILLANNVAPAAPVSEKHIRKAWQQVHGRLEAEAKPYGYAQWRTARLHRQRPGSWITMAAAFTGLLLGVFGFWLFTWKQHHHVTYTSRSSQVIPVSLPDGSQVLLNANSSLSFRKNWQDDQEREVWLQGEAFFSVTKKPTQGLPTFTVHANKVQVQVLGTQFNVADRSDKTQVILNTGKIKLLLPGTGKPKVVTMVPGDYVALAGKSGKITKARVNPAAFSGWRSHKLKFNNTPLAEIIGQIEQTYGTKVTLTDSLLLSRTFTGTFPNDNLPVLVKTLEKAFQLRASRQGKNLILEKAADS